MAITTTISIVFFGVPVFSIGTAAGGLWILSDLVSMPRNRRRVVAGGTVAFVLGSLLIFVGSMRIAWGS
jgi:hypothetical protein